MIKRYHEAPKMIFEKVQDYTDGDYALVHLFESDREYFDMFKRAVQKGRDVILDNSIFELGESFDHARFAYWVNQLRPTWYIVPDVWKDGKATAQMFNEFVEEYPRLPGMRIGVAQGHTLNEVAECYMAIESKCDMVAFNLDFSSYCEVDNGLPYCVRMSLGRFEMLRDLMDAQIINTNKCHHLLGCGVPQEIMWYPEEWSWIRSIDTCNPVLHGMLGHLYNKDMPGLLYKLPQKMCDLMNSSITRKQWLDVKYNLEMMQTMGRYRECKKS